MGFEQSTEDQPKVEEDNGKECSALEHGFKTIFKCDQQNCPKFVCRKCLGAQDQSGKRYCLLCAANKEIDKEDLLFDQNMGKIVQPFDHILKVERDKVTGEVTGWDLLFQHLEKTSQIQEKMLLEAKKVRRELDKRKKQQASFTIMPTDVMNLYLLKNTETEQLFDIKVLDQGDGKAEIVGLPNQLTAFLFNFTDKELLQDTIDVINVLITMYDSKGNGQVNIINELPTEEEFKAQLSEVRNIQKLDPSKLYDIQTKLGQGGFAKVFKVKRKTDSFICALKFVEPKNEKERLTIINEIGLMQMCTDNNIMLKLFEAYDFKERLWMLVELMDDALTSYVQNWHKQYSENICKYVLKRALQGLNYLHERNIIHRDIKSDNLLMNVQGDIKLADFGYAVQLTTEQAARASKVGTVCWMAPELIKGERKYTTKIDIWSFGIFAMEMADGDPPYISEPQNKVIFKIVNQSPPLIGPRWSEDFRQFVKLCLTKDPNERPSAATLLEHPFLLGADKHKEEFAVSATRFMTLKRQQMGGQQN